MCKENKNNDQQFVSSTSPYSAILESITYVNNVCNECMRILLFAFRSKCKQCIRVRCCWHRTACVVYVCDTLQNGTIGWRRGDKLLNKVVIFVFFAHKKYSRSFVKWQLNHWCHMDYFNDVLASFLSLDRVRILAVYGRVGELSEFIRNILICVPKMNEGLTGLEWNEE